MAGNRQIRRVSPCSLPLLWLLILVPACHKPTEREVAEQKAIERHERESAQKQVFMEMIRRLGEAKIGEGVELFAGLGRQGRLPGISGKAVHGSIRIDQLPVIAPKGPYFLSAEVRIITDSSPPVNYHYMLVEAYSNSSFQIHRAWETDASGKMVEEFPIGPARPQDPNRIFLGPANAGAESGMARWYSGTLGGGFVGIGIEEPATGLSCFTIGITNAIPAQTHHADFRSEMFTVGDTGERLSFSFDYKLPETVKAGDDIHVLFRFFDETGTNFLSQEEIRVGSDTNDSEMPKYKTISRSVLPPARAVNADISVSANIDGPWTSGMALFDDFCVTSHPGNRRLILLIRVSSGVAAVLVLTFFLLRRRRARAARVTDEDPPPAQTAEHASAPVSTA